MYSLLSSRKQSRNTPQRGHVCMQAHTHKYTYMKHMVHAMDRIYNSTMLFACVNRCNSSEAQASMLGQKNCRFHKTFASVFFFFWWKRAAILDSCPNRSQLTYTSRKMRSSTHFTSSDQDINVQAHPLQVTRWSHYVQFAHRFRNIRQRLKNLQCLSYFHLKNPNLYLS